MRIDLQALYTQGEWVLRILTAALCGCVIGAERTSRNKEAGLRTHALVALGAALVMVVSKFGFYDISGGDGARLAAQVVSGIGFLGAGMIFVRYGSISGLTTAAGMWVTSGIGLCIGSGLYGVGIVTTVLVFSLQKLFHQGFVMKKYRQTLHLQLEVAAEEGVLQTLLGELKALTAEKMDIQDMTVEKLRSNTISLQIEITVPREYDRNRILMAMAEKAYVIKVLYLS